VDIAIHIVFEEIVLGSQGTFIVSCTTFTRWRGAKLVSVETLIDSHRACLFSREAVLGSQRISVVSTETCFQEVARGALATLILAMFTHM